MALPVAARCRLFVLEVTCDLRLRYPVLNRNHSRMVDVKRPHKVVIVGAGPVGSLAALYAASRGDDVEMYELRGGMSPSLLRPC